MKKNIKDNNITAQFVGYKNIKTTGAVRMEFDIPQNETHKVPFGKIDSVFKLFFVEVDRETGKKLAN